MQKSHSSNRHFVGYVRLLLTALLLFSLPERFVCAADPVLSLTDILSRYRAAVGPEPPHGTQRTTGTEETGGLKGTYVTLKHDHKVWTERKLGIYDSFDGSDGRVFWHKDSSDNASLLFSEDMKDRFTDDTIERSELTQPDTFQGKVTLRPQTEKRTGDYILDVVPDGGSAITLFLDPQTFLLTHTERDKDGDLVITTYSKYKKMAGQMQATLIRTHTDKSKAKYDDVITVDAIEDAPDPDPAIFDVPSAPKNYTWAVPGAASAILPFNDADNGIALCALVNGHPTYLTLDSGEGSLAMVKVAADRLGLRHQGVFQGLGYGGTVEYAPVLLSTLELIGGVIFHNITASSLSVEPSFANYQAIDSVGLLGYPLFSRFIVKVNYAAGQVTLSDPDRWTPTPADGTPLPLDLANDVPCIQASFDGLPPARFLVDTGAASSAVMLYGPYVQANKLAQKYAHGLERGGRGVGGWFQMRRVRADSFTLAGQTFGSVPTDLSLDTKGICASQALAGAVGHDFLSRFTVTFDYPHKRIFFVPVRDALRPFDTRTFGVYVMKYPDEDHPNSFQKVIVYVEAKSPAARAGVSAGQILEKIDGKDISTLDLAAVRHLLSKEGGSETRKLTVISREFGLAGSQWTGRSDVSISLYDPLPAAGDRR